MPTLFVLFFVTVSAAVFVAAQAQPRPAASAAESRTHAAPATVTLKVHGMGCDSCATAVEQAARQIDGVTEAAVDFDSATARVSFDSRRLSAETLAKLLTRRSGYEVSIR